MTTITDNTQPHTTRTIYARLRGAIITRRGAWSVTGNPNFGRCSCGGTTICGICQRCGLRVQCAWDCKRHKSGSHWIITPRIPAGIGEISHTCCPECARRVLEEIYAE